MIKKIYRAGTIPYFIENKTIKMLFMVPSDSRYGGDLPQIAKGKQEDDETLLETAFREAEEELGLKRSNVLNFFKVGTFLGRTEIFVAKILNFNDFNEFNYETNRTIWLTDEEFYIHGRELHKEIIFEVVKLIKYKEDL